MHSMRLQKYHKDPKHIVENFRELKQEAIDEIEKIIEEITEFIEKMIYYLHRAANSLFVIARSTKMLSLNSYKNYISIFQQR